MQKGTKQALRIIWQVVKLVLFDQKKRVWRNAIAAVLRRDNPWGCRSLETVEQFFRTVEFEVDSEALALIGLDPEQVPVDVYIVDITDLGMPRSTHTEQIRSAFRKFELTNISLDVWEHLRLANLGIQLPCDNCYSGGIKHGRLRIYIAVREPPMVVETP